MSETVGRLGGWICELENETTTGCRYMPTADHRPPTADCPVLTTNHLTA